MINDNYFNEIARIKRIEIRRRFIFRCNTEKSLDFFFLPLIDQEGGRTKGERENRQERTNFTPGKNAEPTRVEHFFVLSLFTQSNGVALQKRSRGKFIAFESFIIENKIKNCRGFRAFQIIFYDAKKKKK